MEQNLTKSQNLTVTETRRSRIVVPTESPNDPNYIVQPGTGFDGVVGLGQNGLIDCTGALLYTGRHILTAAHCFDQSDIPNLNPNPNDYTIVFNLPNGRFTVAANQIFVHPEWTSDFDNNHDIAMIELTQTAPETADRYDIYTESNEVSQVFIKVGYGLEGTGQTGENFDGSTSVKRIGKNRYDAFSEIFNTDPNSNILPNTQLAYDFDNGLPQNDAFGIEYGRVDLGLGTQEIGISAGDSGAPAFIGGKIAGLSSFGQNPSQSGISVTENNDTSFGEFFSDTRVSIYADWIEQTIAISNQGNNLILGTNARNDFLNGNQGNDTLKGLAQNDSLFGGQGNDELYGNEGQDSLNGNQGDDWIEGGLDNDQLFGGRDQDTLVGSEGEDTLSGNLGQDFLSGGLGSDVFILNRDSTSIDPNQADQITDFTPTDFLGLTEDLTLERLSFEFLILGQTPGVLIRETESNTILGFVQNSSIDQVQHQIYI
ncbi:MAG: trypsin-like serine protease [Microcoleaceae cyanobacterium]